MKKEIVCCRELQTREKEKENSCDIQSTRIWDLSVSLVVILRTRIKKANFFGFTFKIQNISFLLNSSPMKVELFIKNIKEFNRTCMYLILKVNVRNKDFFV